MYEGFLTFGGAEILNSNRTLSYLKQHAPTLDVLCDIQEDFGDIVGDGEYDSPSADGAPWYSDGLPDSDDFWGFFPQRVEGIENSTRLVEVTELSGDGAVQSLPRHGSREVRVRATGFAKTKAAMSAGMVWLREALDTDNCGSAGGCEGGELNYFTEAPADTIEAGTRQRTMFRVSPLDGPRVTEFMPSRTVVMWQVEFVLSVGVPWAYSSIIDGVIIDDIAGVEAAQVACNLSESAYETLVFDPQGTPVVRPPLAPTIDPTPMPVTWYRRTGILPAKMAKRTGRMAPQIEVYAESVMRMMRIRIYETGADLSGCGFESEFVITYMPAGSFLQFDSIAQQIHLVDSAGNVHQASNLVIGADGRPLTWPTLACPVSYTVVVDTQAIQSGTTVTTSIRFRE